MGKGAIQAAKFAAVGADAGAAASAALVKSSVEAYKISFAVRR